MKTFVVTAAITLIASQAFAQTPDSTAPSTRETATAEADLATPTGHELSAGVASYTYREPGAQAISIHGAKFVADYTGTLSLNKERHWFAQADLRGTIGSTAYDGWCAPFLITPDSASPNGYALDVGDRSPCNETGDKDGYQEARGLRTMCAGTSAPRQ
jgi:hypothetical protein